MKTSSCKLLGTALTVAAFTFAGFMPATANAGLTVNGTPNGTWDPTATMTYDNTSTDPTTVTAPVNAFYLGYGGAGSLNQTSGSLTLNAIDYGAFIGQGSTATDTISGGSQTWNASTPDDPSIYVGHAAAGTLNVNGGTVTLNSTNLYIGSGGGTGLLNINGGTLISNATTLTLIHIGGQGHIVFGAGAGVLDMTSLSTLTFYDGGPGGDGSDNCYINFLTGSQGQLQINGWTQTQFDTLVGLKDIRIDGVLATATDFNYSNVGGTGVYELATAVPEPTTWAMLLGGLGMLTMFRRRRA